jgi:adenosylmethionine-8-amino-7-oxononanoate aminotransferase
MAAKIAGVAMANGLWMVSWYDSLMIAPPLIITEQQIDEALEILEKSLDIGDREAEKTGVPVSRSSEF